ncbi:OmpA family protein [Mesorhizobium sp.]|uniref:OmpA family protein n=1 Tax=Mesorhizobium sp. TaxID=1871066 RepID=UPI00338EAD4F
MRHSARGGADPHRTGADDRRVPTRGHRGRGPHRCEEGSDAYNQALSEQRAAAVIDWLVAEAGQPHALFTARGLGEQEPVAPNLKADGSDDPDGRQMNRRVEFVFPNAGRSGGG